MKKSLLSALIAVVFFVYASPALAESLEKRAVSPLATVWMDRVDQRLEKVRRLRAWDAPTIAAVLGLRNALAGSLDKYLSAPGLLRAGARQSVELWVGELAQAIR